LNLFIILTMFVLACSPPPKEKHETATPEETTDCGWQVGQVACDFTFFNHKDKKVSLSDYKGKTILLDLSTMWCYWCNIAAYDEPKIQKLYSRQGFTWFTVLTQNRNGDRPSCADLVSWVKKFDITSPVLSGDGSILDLEDDGVDIGYRVGGWPTFIIIDKNMVIKKYIYGWSYENITLAIEEAL